MNAPSRFSGRGVTAVLGPTNTGKTHLAIERMLTYPSGMIGLPLRLLAREVYDKICVRIGRDKVSLITGEEKIIVADAPYSVCTVEAMGRETRAAFVAIDEVQLAANFERGHVFTDRILHLRGAQETLLLGAATMRPILQKLLPDIEIQSRPRLSQLTYSGQKKVSRLPRRSSIIAFSADEVYAIAEFIRRQRGGAAVVLGALSPRSRNRQVALYQSGEVDFLVATDAIGMGLNLEVDHVAFSALRKFDGFQHRFLQPAEIGQIAGRAGRHLRDGTFGVTGRVEPFEAALVEQLEGHIFPPVERLQWRSEIHDFTSLAALKRSLERPATLDGLTRALPATDARALDVLSRDEEIVRLVEDEAALRLLWDVCALPDYVKISPAQHADLIARLYRDLRLFGAVDEDYISRQVTLADAPEGDIDTLSHRIAHIRNWTYIANRPGWLKNPRYWQEKTKDVEDKLSDALHQRLTQRFVNRTTSILMKRLRENAMIEAEISHGGDVLVEGHLIGQLQGFRFTPTDKGVGDGGEALSRLDAKALRAAAQKALVGQYGARAKRLSLCPNGDLAIGSDGVVRWLGAPVASLVSGDEFLRPQVVLLADDALNGAARDEVMERLQRFVRYHFESALKPLFDLAILLKMSEDKGGLSGHGRALAYQLLENHGSVARRDVADNVKMLAQKERVALRERGLRFGMYSLFIPALLKPVAAQALTLLWVLQHDAKQANGYGDVLAACASGRPSLVVESGFRPQFYRLAGYQIFGRRAVRLDRIESLADLIREALEWREGVSKTPRPPAHYDGRQFLVSSQMLSTIGVPRADMEEILKKLGYRYHSVTQARSDVKLNAKSKQPTVPAAECVGSAWDKETEPLPLSLPQAEPVGQFIAKLEQFGECPSETKAALMKKTEETGEKTVQLWHFHYRREEGRGRRSSNQAQARPSQAQQARANRTGGEKQKQPRPHKRDEHQGKDNRPLKSKTHHRSMNNKGAAKRVERPIDPDSPFAKLAALRDKLKK